MKRNRLLRASKRTSLFSNVVVRSNKRRNLLALSLLAFSGVFITTIVLATSTPQISSTHSQIISLPNSNGIEAQTASTDSVQTVSTIVVSPTIQKHDNDTATQAVPDLALAEITAQERAFAEAEAVLQQQIIKAKAELTWQEITVKSGDNLSLIFPRVGLTARDVYEIAQLGKDIKPLLNLKPGQTLRFGFDVASTESNKKILKQLDLQLSPIKQFLVTADADGFTASTTTRDVEKRQLTASGRIESSLFEAGLEAGLSNKIIMELAYIFGWDIDFALDIRQNDHFTLIYQQDYLEGDKIADGPILAAEFTNQGKTFRAVRFTDDDGSSRYYSPSGDSMRKAFSRTPVHFSRISSRFNPNRKHPVLKTSRPHRGVDYAASRGTPILATGDGKVDFVGTKGGYGHTIVLTHGGKYTTLYAHMSKYRKGIKRGQRVKQGQTIGYVGSSGLATGPHLHYEFRVNGVHRNPLTVALPKAESLPKKYRADFDLQAQPLLAQLDVVNNTTLALND